MTPDLQNQGYYISFYMRRTSLLKAIICTILTFTIGSGILKGLPLPVF